MLKDARLADGAAADQAPGPCWSWRRRRWRSSGPGGGASARRLSGDREGALVGIALAGLAGFVWFIVIAILDPGRLLRQQPLSRARLGPGRDLRAPSTWGWLALGARLAPGAGGWAGRRAARPARAVGGYRAGRSWRRSVLFVPNVVGNNLISIPRTHGALVYQAQLRPRWPTIVRNYGGANKLLACGSVMTEGFQVPMVAWTLGRAHRSGAGAAAPGVDRRGRPDR